MKIDRTAARNSVFALSLRARAKQSHRSFCAACIGKIHFSIWIISLILMAACVGCGTGARSPQTQIGFSADEIATLQSLEQVDDYPLYVMHYAGAYNYPKTGFSWPPGSDFACSLFATLPPDGERLYGRNFDWDFSPALLLYTDPPDGYASVSMVDLTFLDIRPDDAASLGNLPLADRAGLLAAPAMPFDGMNEYGLAIGMAAVPDTGQGETGGGSSKPTIGSIGIIRMILDHARSVDEAVKIFERYAIDFSGGPTIHYLVADASGKAVLVETYHGELTVLPNEVPWHLATNHLRCVATGDGGCWRYRTLSERLTAAAGHLDGAAAMQLLSEVAQDGTQWSITYNMTSGDGAVVVGRDYDTAYSFHLEHAKP